MKSIFDSKTSKELAQRILALQSTDKAQWGKMTPYQMLKHCTLSDEMFHGKKTYKRLFIGRLFGGMALKGILKDDSPMKHNQPTHPEMKITGTGDFSAERSKWLELIQGYSSYANGNFVHPFFGVMNREQIGEYVYKHTDHHLRQFGR